jgi:hypothetical protein
VLVLADQLLDYNMRATLTNAIPIERCDALSRFVGDYIPFEIEGPMSAVQIKPDFGEILRNRVREEVRESVQDRLRDRLRDLL